MLTPFLRMFGKMQVLPTGDLRQAVYALIDSHKTITVSVLRQYLLAQDFQPTEDALAILLEDIAYHDKLSVRRVNQTLSYGFGADSDEKEQVYLEREACFYEIHLKGKVVTATEGKIDEEGTVKTHCFYKNFQAATFFHHLFTQKWQEGYRIGFDRRVPAALWEEYRHLAGLRPVACHIGYQDVLKTEPSQELKVARYLFSWNLPDSRRELQLVLENRFWTNQQFHCDAARLLSEKTIGHKASPAAFPMLEMDNARICQLILCFENGEEVVFLKSRMSLAEELLPLAKRLITNA